VFFKGCSLECAWCHNPESISPRPQIHWIGTRCIGCRTCLETCPEKALSLTREGLRIDRLKCDGCGLCAAECPSTALELLGQVWNLDDLVHETLKDRVYFEKSNGGVTVSGGEPTLQAVFVGEFLKRIRAEGLQTALDTCGLCSRKAFELLLPHTSLVLFDFKQIDPERHRLLTGSDNRRILENLVCVSQYISDHLYPQGLWIRTPLIPGATDTPENISGIGQWIAANLGPEVRRWELCTFNNLCRDKYLRLGLNWQFENTPLLSEKKIELLANVAGSSGVDPGIVHWSGTTRTETDDPEEESTRTGLKVVT
jgi:pyruvate formate lyase activating enzyme